jgi:hypothetical protein
MSSASERKSSGGGLRSLGVDITRGEEEGGEKADCDPSSVSLTTSGQRLSKWSMYLTGGRFRLSGLPILIRYER